MMSAMRKKEGERMFTGIIEEKGTVKSIQRQEHSAVLTIEATKVLTDAAIGDSIAVNGVCLTVTKKSNNYFMADVMAETLRRSSLGTLKNGNRVNLERAMPANGRFGGHIVSGHIDGTGTVMKLEAEGNAVWVQIGTKEELLKYIVPKGSIAIDGISLTVAKVEKDSFYVTLIPHTGQETTLLIKRAGEIVNLENDIVGKYVDRLLHFHEKQTETKEKASTITMDFLVQHGF